MCCTRVTRHDPRFAPCRPGSEGFWGGPVLRGLGGGRGAGTAMSADDASPAGLELIVGRVAATLQAAPSNFAAVVDAIKNSGWLTDFSG